MKRLSKKLVLFFFLPSFFLTNFLLAQNQMNRAIHMGGNWGENRPRGIATQPEDYYTFLRNTSVSWAGITVGLRLEHSMDSTIEKDYNEQLTVPTFRDQPLRDAVRGFKNHRIKVMLSLAIESDAAQHPQYPFQRWQLGDPKAYLTDANIKPENWPWDPAHPNHTNYVSKFWNTYAQEAAYFAKIAQQESVDLFSIGAETDRLFRTRIGGQFTNEFKNYIKAVVDSVKKYFTGLVTYEQHWSALIDQAGFGPAIDNIWEDVGLNAIGISAYFRLTDPAPSRVFTIPELEAAWNNIFTNHLVPLKNRHPNLPIHFLEFGYVDVLPSIYFADTDVFKPYIFKDDNGNGLDDGQEQQSNTYDAFFRVNETNNRLVQSTFMWDVQIASDANWAAGFGNMRIHSFRGKLSEIVIRNWYSQFTPLPSIPILISPINNLQNSPINNLRFDWEDATEASQYHLQISKDANFTNLLISDQNIFQSNFVYNQNLISNTQYWWRVKSKNAAGESGWSSVFSFTTIALLPSDPIPFEPTNGAINIPTTTKLKWRKSTYADNYEVEVSTKQDFSSIFFSNTSLIDTTVSLINLNNGKKYYWRVRAKNTSGTSNWSLTFTFNVIPQIPTAPLIIEPINGAIDVVVNPILRWRKILEADNYSLQISMQSNFSSLYYNNTSIADTLIALQNLPNSTLFYWRVSSKNSAGTSGWSQTFLFTTKNPVGVEEENFTITEFKLYQNYPNPFNPTTTIRYSVPTNMKGEAVNVTLKVFDVLGREVEMLVDEFKQPGSYYSQFLASSPARRSGSVLYSKLPSGQYFYQLRIGNYIETKKMILLR